MTPIERLVKLRDNYKKAGKLVEVKAIERAIDIFKRPPKDKKRVELAEVQLDQ